MQILLAWLEWLVQPLWVRRLLCAGGQGVRIGTRMVLGGMGFVATRADGEKSITLETVLAAARSCAAGSWLERPEQAR